LEHLRKAGQYKIRYKLLVPNMLRKQHTLEKIKQIMVFYVYNTYFKQYSNCNNFLSGMCYYNLEYAYLILEQTLILMSSGKFK